MQKPTIGRIVHFFSAGETTPQAAIVIDVHSDVCVTVQACNNGGTWNTKRSVSFDEGASTSERWCWPPRA